MSDSTLTVSSTQLHTLVGDLLNNAGYDMGSIQMVVDVLSGAEKRVAASNRQVLVAFEGKTNGRGRARLVVGSPKEWETLEDAVVTRASGADFAGFDTEPAPTLYESPLFSFHKQAEHYEKFKDHNKEK